MTADTAEREAFEAWLFPQINPNGPHALWTERRGTSYAHPVTRGGWEAWQARAALPARAPEGWALVPREPTQSMLDVMRGCESGDRSLTMHQAWAAMLSAAPPPPEQKLWLYEKVLDAFERAIEIIESVEKDTNYAVDDWTTPEEDRFVNKAKALIKRATSFPPGHASDCALHNGPAMEPGSCDCGADPSMTPERYGSEWPTTKPLASPAPGPAEPVVRALEWKPIEWARGALVAECAVGRYDISRSFDGFVAALHSADMHHIGEGAADALKAAAQADYERRILSALQPAQLTPSSVPDIRDKLIEHLGDALLGAYDCTRVWEAWFRGTMGHDDFEPVNNRLEEIVDGVLVLLASTPQSTDPAARAGTRGGPAPAERGAGG